MGVASRHEKLCPDAAFFLESAKYNSKKIVYRKLSIHKLAYDLNL